MPVSRCKILELPEILYFTISFMLITIPPVPGSDSIHSYILDLGYTVHIICMIRTNTLYIRVLRLVPALKYMYNLNMHERPVCHHSTTRPGHSYGAVHLQVATFVQTPNWISKKLKINLNPEKFCCCTYGSKPLKTTEKA